MHIGICEDETIQMEYLNQEIKKYYRQKNIKIIIENFQNAEELLFKYPGDLPFDCLILDIKMKRMDGMELARKIRERDKDINIIFVTGDKGAVFDGYKVGAARYILKPIHLPDLVEALEYVHGEESETDMQEDHICLNYAGDFVKISRREILSVEVSGHYITIYAKERKFTYKETMKHIIQQLGDERFVMANRSVLVNLDYVESITGKECVMSDGHVYSISRNAYSEFNRRFIDYYK